jgi:T5SS/PEP-CTERM-associated repeat protein
MNSMKRHALAVACALGCSTPGFAAITVTGAVGTGPIGVPIGPGDTLIPDLTVYVGGTSTGQLDVGGGSLLDAGYLYLSGLSGTGGSSSGTLNVSGAGSRVRLLSNPDGVAVGRRLTIGDWGTARVIVEAGGVLDGRQSPSTCPLLNGAGQCGSVMGVAAGTFAELVVRDPGSRVELASFFSIGSAFVRSAAQGGELGTPGGVTTARIEVSNGALLRTDRATVGFGPTGPSALGTERTFSNIIVAGANSVWNIAGGTVDAQTSSLSTATHANATVNLAVTGGGRIDLSQVPNTTHFINLSSGAGRTDMVISGAGSAVNLNAGVFQVGRALNGTARLDVTAGGTVNDAYYFSVGRGGSNGRLVIDGAGSRITVNRTGVPGSPDSGFTGAFDIGRDGGVGQVDMTNGARIEVLSGTATTERARTVRLGNGAASQGTLNMSGADTRFVMDVASVVAGGGPTEVFNPYLSVGYQGVGYLNVSGGAKLLMNGGAVGTVADNRTTLFIVGGRDDVNPGGQGFATITGAGSELRMTGTDPILWVGRGPSSNGQLTVSNGALVSSRTLLVGRTGAVGVMTIDSAVVDLTGQQTGNNLSGAGVSIGSGVGSTGVLNMNNGALLNLANPGGTAAVVFGIGGSGSVAGGDGVLQMNGGSRILLSGGPAGSAAVSIGREGAAFARLRGGSQIDAGDGTLYIGRFAGSDGTLIASEASTVTAGWVGVGRNRTGGPTGTDGGTGTFVLNGATLNAVDVVIGTNGFLGGTAGSINVSGSLTNYGIFSPGSSPGTFTINGNYTAGAGSRLILEVQALAGGGFSTDQVFFSEGAALDFAGMNVEFRFLGDTDPNAFQASGGFDIDTFLARNLSGGGTAGLNPALLAATTFSAQADGYVFQSFSFDPGTGATFSAVPVPEPGTWLLWLGGIAALVARRKATRT